LYSLLIGQLVINMSDSESDTEPTIAEPIVVAKYNAAGQVADSK